MPEDMGTFRIDVELENPALPGARRTFADVLVDTGAELSVFPADQLDSMGIVRMKQLRFRQADGTIFTRWTGSARLYAAHTVATDDVVFGEPGDITLLGARSLEGLNVRIDPVTRQLVDAGPMPLAATRLSSNITVPSNPVMLRISRITRIARITAITIQLAGTAVAGLLVKLFA